MIGRYEDNNNNDGVRERESCAEIFCIEYIFYST